jgi:hypothetical protein
VPAVMCLQTAAALTAGRSGTRGIRRDRRSRPARSAPRERDEAGRRGAQVRGQRRQLVLAAELVLPALVPLRPRPLNECCLHCQPD